MSNGDTPTVVPGQTLGTTPPILPTQGGSVDDQTKKILEMLTRSVTQRRLAATPRPSPIPGMTDPSRANQIGMNTSWPSKWGFERFAAGLQSSIGNAVARHKESQIVKAEATFEYYGNLVNNFLAAQSGGDPKAVEEAQKKLDDFARDKGNMTALHKAAKALNQSWLDPEKTDAYGTAMQRTMAKQKQKDQARSGIQNMFRKVMGMARQPQPQLSPEESVQAGRQILGRAPTASPTLDVNTMRTIADFEKAANAARTSYQVRQAADGTLEAFNPKNPQEPVIPLRDSEGKPLTGKAPPKEGTLYTMNGMPQGVFHGGKPVYPGDPEWSEHDKKIFEQGAFSAKEKQLLRLPPEIAAQVGDPPDPKDYEKGRSDPKYGKALAEFGKKAETIRERELAAGRMAGAEAAFKYRTLQTMDAEGNVYWDLAPKVLGQASSAEGIKLLPREQQMNDIQVASGKMRDSINSLGVDKFSAAQIAKLQYALETEDPSLANTELASLASQDLTDAQQDFVIWVRQLNERAMSLRNVAGMGTGAQDLRTAIRAMIPGIRSGSKQMMLKQLDAFDNQVSILKKGIAHPGKTGGGEGGKTVMMLAPDGKTKKPVPADQVEHYKSLGATVYNPKGTTQ